jgi:hypothetical protein
MYRGMLRRSLAAGLSVLAVACGTEIFISPSGIGVGRGHPHLSVTFLSYESDQGDYIGLGETRAYWLDDAVWNARFDTINGLHHVSISATQFSGPSFSWYLDLAAPRGQRLAIGKYENARRYPFQPVTQPGLSFAGSGRGCHTLTGRFEIQSIVLGPGDTVDRLQATFEQSCEGGSPALSGRVSIAANPWR